MAKEIPHRPWMLELKLQHKIAEIAKKETELNSVSSDIADLSEQVHTESSIMNTIHTYLTPEETDQERIAREEREACWRFQFKCTTSRQTSEDAALKAFFKNFATSTDQCATSVVTKEITPEETEQEVTIELELIEAISKSAELDAKISALKAEFKTLIHTKEMHSSTKLSLVNSMCDETKLSVLTKAQEDGNEKIVELFHSIGFDEHTYQERQAAGDADEIPDIFN